ncbi:GatB/YqeY domain-containing protein [Candidatus Auribacterota bacterium]
MKTHLSNHMRSAMKKGERNVVDVLRMVLADIQKEEIDTKEKLTNDDIIRIIKRGIKAREESLKMYIEADRSDLAKKEEEEIKVLLEYLPKQLTADEIEEIVQEVVKELDLSSKKDTGKLMKEIMGRYGSQVDGKKVQVIAQKFLK